MNCAFFAMRVKKPTRVFAAPVLLAPTKNLRDENGAKTVAMGPLVFQAHLHAVPKVGRVMTKAVNALYVQQEQNG